jgi:hypothetical protein
MKSREQNIQCLKISSKILQHEAIDNTIKSVNQLEQQVQLLFQIKKLSLVEDIKKFYEYEIRYI